MKNILFVIVAIITFFFNIENIAAQSKFDSWPELKAFHKVMSQTFHPSEKGDLAPIKERIGEMVEKANALAASKVPAEFNTKPIIAAVSKLQKDSAKLQKTINVDIRYVLFIIDKFANAKHIVDEMTIIR